MRTTIIHLELHDDLVSTCDKMDWCKTGRILLVWPGGPFLLNRRLDLALLLRHSQKLGAQLALVCMDLDTRNKAVELGIPVFQVETEAQRKPWRRTRPRGRFSFLKESGQAAAVLMEKVEEKSSSAWKNARVRAAIFSIGLIAFAALVLVFVPGGRIILPAGKSDQSLESYTTHRAEFQLTNGQWRSRQWRKSRPAELSRFQVGLPPDRSSF
jgi:hypothetical protein